MSENTSDKIKEIKSYLGDEISLMGALHKMADLNNVIRDTHGNLSVRCADRNKVAIKPSGMDYSSIQLSDICLYDMVTGEVHSQNNRKPSVDLQHHLAIYKKNDNIKSICHTHSPFATTLSAIVDEIPVLFTEHADYFGQAIRVSTCLDTSWGFSAASTINENSVRGAILLESHGVITWGTSPEEAVKLACALENISEKVYNLACLVSVKNLAAYALGPSVVNQFHYRYWNNYGQ